MSTPQKVLDIMGDKPYQKKARKVLPILVRQAKAAKVIFYSDLAKEVGIQNPRNLNYPLGSIGMSLKKLSMAWGEDIPQIQALVVNKHTGLPGEGISDFINESDNNFKSLTSRKKKILIDNILNKIYLYDKWDEVLRAFGLSSTEVSDEFIKIHRDAAEKYVRGGEGERHKKFKLYIANNPQIIGVSRKLKSCVEHPLPSGDSIDVSFENDNVWIGVEVKSIKSLDHDILRGLYQCVKYRSVMEAFLNAIGIEKDVDVILVIEGEFPKKLIPLKNVLGIKVIDNISMNHKC